MKNKHGFLSTGKLQKIAEYNFLYCLNPAAKSEKVMPHDYLSSFHIFTA
jgi:hypothetical protein